MVMNRLVCFVVRSSEMVGEELEVAWTMELADGFLLRAELGYLDVKNSLEIAS